MSKEVKRYTIHPEGISQITGWGPSAVVVLASDHDAAIEALLAERDALKKDAERLSWLIDNGVCALSVVGDPIRLTREAIDAAMQGEQP